MQGKKFISPGAWFSMNYPSDWNEFEDGEGSFLFYNPDVWTGNFRISAFKGKAGYGKDAIRQELKENDSASLVKVGTWECAYSKEMFQEEGTYYTSHLWITGVDDIAFECSFTVPKGGVVKEAEDVIATLEVRKEAQKYMDLYFERYPGVLEYMERTRAQAKEQGYVETLMHRRRDLPELTASNFNTRSFGERVARNMPIQGTAADVIKLAMVRVDNRLRKEQLKAKLILQVHDELIVECPEEEKERVAALLTEEMEGAMHLSVPLTAEAHWGKNWLEAK